MQNGVSTILGIVAAVAIMMIVIGYAFSTVNSQKEVADDSMSQIAQMTAAISDADINNLLGSAKMGSEVLMTIARYENNSNGVFIKVVNISGGSEIYICAEDGTPFTTAEEAAKMAAAKDARSATYINPTGKFQVLPDPGQGLVYNDATGALEGIIFTQQP